MISLIIEKINVFFTGVAQVPRYEFVPSNRLNSSYWNQGHYTPLGSSPIINQYPSQNYDYAPPPPVTIINTNINNHIQYPTYSYSRSDYGDNDLGFFLGYKLGRMFKPSYHYYTPTYYNGHEHIPFVRPL